MRRTPDGKYLAGGVSNGHGEGDHAFLMRVLPNLKPDTSYGAGSVLESPSNFELRALLVLDSGAALAAGCKDGHYAAFRATAAGNIDASYSVNGVRTFEKSAGETQRCVYAMTRAADGGFWLVGAKFDVLKLTSGGEADTAFGDNGWIAQPLPAGLSNGTAHGVVERADGHLFVSGSAVNVGALGVLAVYKDGALDQSFFDQGAMRSESFAGSAHLVSGPDDAIVLGATSSPNYQILRVKGTGLDPSFGTGGRATIPMVGFAIVNDIVALDDAIVVFGESSSSTAQDGSARRRVAVVRLNNDGSLDSDFGNDGRASFEVNGGHPDVANAGVVDAAGITVSGQDGRNVDSPDAVLLWLRLDAGGTLTIDESFPRP